MGNPSNITNNQSYIFDLIGTDQNISNIVKSVKQTKYYPKLNGVVDNDISPIQPEHHLKKFHGTEFIIDHNIVRKNQNNEQKQKQHNKNDTGSIFNRSDIQQENGEQEKRLFSMDLPQDKKRNISVNIQSTAVVNQHTKNQFTAESNVGHDNLDNVQQEHHLQLEQKQNINDQLKKASVSIQPNQFVTTKKTKFYNSADNEPRRKKEPRQKEEKKINNQSRNEVITNHTNMSEKKVKLRYINPEIIDNCTKKRQKEKNIVNERKNKSMTGQEQGLEKQGPVVHVRISDNQNVELFHPKTNVKQEHEKKQQNNSITQKEQLKKHQEKEEQHQEKEEKQKEKKSSKDQLKKEPVVSNVPEQEQVKKQNQELKKNQYIIPEMKEQLKKQHQEKKEQHQEKEEKRKEKRNSKDQLKNEPVISNVPEHEQVKKQNQELKKNQHIIPEKRKEKKNSKDQLKNESVINNVPEQEQVKKQNQELKKNQYIIPEMREQLKRKEKKNSKDQLKNE